MNSSDRDEVIGIGRRIGPVILATVPTKLGTSIADLQLAVGAMVADEVGILSRTTFSLALTNCLNLARAAGATLVSMGMVRLAALAETPRSLSAIGIVQAIVLLGLAQEARLVTAMQFKSRDDAAAVADTMNAAFSAAAEAAADDLDAATYVSIINLQSATIRYLADIGRLLPRIINYEYPISMPALAMSQRVYGDASRAIELIDENKVVHPAFMPLTGRMLAV
jgi:prophage DNA circulation protein